MFKERDRQNNFSVIWGESMSNSTAIINIYILEVNIEFSDIPRLDLNLSSQILTIDTHAFIVTQGVSSFAEKICGYSRSVDGYESTMSYCY